MPDLPPGPLHIEHGPLMTLAEASRKTGRPLRLLRRWLQNGTLRCRFRQAKWPYRYLVTDADLMAVVSRKRWGIKRTQRLRNNDGVPVAIRVHTRTASVGRIRNRLTTR
jgi:hypothetical protein